jgi:hypothetical protein
MQSLLHWAMKNVLPSLRVVALVYTGLSGVAALVVVVTAAVAPKAPVVQQVTEATGPARQAVTTLVQPTGDLIASLMPAPAPVTMAPRVQTQPAPTAAPFVDTTSLDITIGEAVPEPQAEVHTAPRPILRFVPQLVEPAAVQDDEDVPSDDQAVDDPVPAVGIATPEVVAAPAGQTAASAEPPKPLPTIAPTPLPETPQQAKARMDAANQAAIDAQKAAAAKAKADADAANQAAISAQKAAATAPALSDSVLVLPTPSISASRSLSARDAAAKAKAEAAAANQAAIDAAKAARPKR